MKKPVRLKSFEQAPLIRKFSVLFLVVSVMPLVVLAYLLRISSAGPVNIEQQGLLFVMILLGCGILIGFSSMRRSILEIHKIARETGEAVLKDIPDFKIDVNDNEIKQLSRTFKEVTRNLENNIKRLEQSKRTLQFVHDDNGLGGDFPQRRHEHSGHFHVITSRLRHFSPQAIIAGNGSHFQVGSPS